MKIKGVVSAGKEARVYWGKGGDGKDLAIKIFLTSSAEFRKSIWKYIQGDPRFENIKNVSTHKLMSIWAKKEYSNLKKMYNADISVPRPICVYRNVLVMEFLGEEGVRAPLLKEVYRFQHPDEEKSRRYFSTLIKNVYKMYWYAGLVHGDLSEYNVMIFRETPYIIDVSQAVRIEHPNAHQFLRRDLSNLIRFFSEEIGIDLPSVEEIYRVIISNEMGKIEEL
ncbi:MAG: serine protein kinase RIO [Ignisphaera sp.]|nr:serine protein kinase RIO [Ignisphaera sp.]MCX8168344.1 serine protein kinase RIO [Ignisphaera sp.]MDW8085323.1 serine protein kinase RIO [Ignisphaera sp.]